MGRYSDKARLVFHYAREEGGRLGHGAIEPQHLLLGLLRVGGPTAELLAEWGVTLEEARAQIEQHMGRGERLRRDHPASITERSRRVLEAAGSEARRLGSGVIATRHMLLGILDEGAGLAYDVLVTRGDVQVLRQRLVDADAGQES